MKQSERIEKLEKELYHLKGLMKLEEKQEPKFEVGKWYRYEEDVFNFLFYATRIEYGVVQGYGFNKEQWEDDSGWIKEDKDFKFVKPATKAEVGKALIAEAKKRGLTTAGTRVRTLTGCTSRWIGDCSDFEYRDGLLLCHTVEIFKDGKWAEIIEEPKVTINGEEMKQEGDIISFGCAKFNKGWFRILYSDIRPKNDNNCRAYTGTNRKIKSITLDSGVEITVEELKQIVNAIT